MFKEIFDESMNRGLRDLRFPHNWHEPDIYFNEFMLLKNAITNFTLTDKQRQRCSSKVVVLQVKKIKNKIEILS